MSVTYTPSFHFPPWLDNVDRVRAAGDGGFNVRFQKLEDEFKQISGVIKQISDALDALAQAPAPAPVTLSLTPTLVATGDAWDHVFGGATKHPGLTDAQGMMAVQLPHGNTIQTLRATGQKDSGNLGINLRRQSLAAGSAPELIVGLTPGAGPFDQTAAVPVGAAAIVDNNQFRYYITAELDSTTAAATVLLSCFQVTHIAPGPIIRF
jgi:hypothetical protein